MWSAIGKVKNAFKIISLLKVSLVLLYLHFKISSQILHSYFSNTKIWSHFLWKLWHRKKSRFITWAYKFFKTSPPPHPPPPRKAIRVLSLCCLSQNQTLATQKNDPSLPKLAFPITDGWSLLFPLSCSLPDKLLLKILLECHLLCKICQKFVFLHLLP